ncbi:MAG: DUF3450 domain-containing protein [Gammaproteobacteria bacterium]
MMSKITITCWVHRLKVALAYSFVTLVLFGDVRAATDPLESAVDTKIKGQKEAVQSQARVDKLADETAVLIGEYRAVTRQTDSLSGYNDQIERLVENQEEELAAIARQLANIEVARRKIVPLMLRMLEVLENFVMLDVPFLPEERRLRIKALKEMMDKPDVSLPDKYRRLMEAYQIEMDYGRTIEAYSGTLEQGGQPRTVDFLRIGRIALLYLSLDGEKTGYWDAKAKTWTVLPKNYNRSIAQGIQIARKQAPPDFITLPISAPVTAQ